MFKKFLSEHSLGEYSFRSDMFPTVEDRAFWENYPSDTCIAEAEAALDYGWPVIKATDFMAICLQQRPPSIWQAFLTFWKSRLLPFAHAF